MSHPAWGAWIEIQTVIPSALNNTGRTPHGVRGLKYKIVFFCLLCLMSHPAWGAWIEILNLAPTAKAIPCRTPHGVRGLKSEQLEYIAEEVTGRTPHGVRGLK